jgi:YhcN/YlaJ family sporulation lipoprotein
LGNRQKSLCAALLSLTLAAAGLSACGNNNPQSTGQNAANSMQNRGAGSYGPKNTTSNARSSHLETLARGVRGVNDANCVVFGNYAIVGIDVDPTMDRSRVGTTKYAVAHALSKDRYGANALVTADLDVAQRIREIRADIGNGRPVAGFAQELADMVGRLIPEAPGGLITPASPDNPDPANPQRGNR